MGERARKADCIQAAQDQWRLSRLAAALDCFADNRIALQQYRRVGRASTIEWTHLQSCFQAQKYLHHRFRSPTRVCELQHTNKDHAADITAFNTQMVLETRLRKSVVSEYIRQLTLAWGRAGSAAVAIPHCSGCAAGLGGSSGPATARSLRPDRLHLSDASQGAPVAEFDADHAI